MESWQAAGDRHGAAAADEVLINARLPFMNEFITLHKTLPGLNVYSLFLEQGTQ